MVIMVERKDTCRILVGKPQGNGSLGRPKRQQKDNITVSLKQCNAGVSWIDRVKDGNN